uniref:Uncharacterized protein n=1 Tax=Arundo donax TaxID=35708 RepID=A0A0A8YBJ7_ARUDO
MVGQMAPHQEQRSIPTL